MIYHIVVWNTLKAFWNNDRRKQVYICIITRFVLFSLKCNQRNCDFRGHEDEDDDDARSPSTPRTPRAPIETAVH